MYELQENILPSPVAIAPQYIEPQHIMLPDQKTIEDDIQLKIEHARRETKNLYSQIDKVKNQIQDANLFEMAKHVKPLNKSNINLSSVLTLKGHNNKVSDFRWSRDSKSVLSASQDGFMLIWDSASGLKQNAIPLDSQWVLSCAMSPNGKLVASAGLNNNCTVYGVSKENRVQQNIQTIFKGHTCYISYVDFLDDSNILTASGDMTCALWNIPKAKRVREYADHLGDVLSLALPPPGSNNNNIFTSCGSDGYAYVWDTRASAAVQHFFVSESDVNAIQFFNDGNSIVTGSDDGVVNMFDLRSDCSIAHYSLQGLQEAEQPTYTTKTMEYSRGSVQSRMSSRISSSYLDNQGVVSLDFSASGRLMYACYTDLGCVVWDTLKAEMVGKLEGHSDRVSGVKTSFDGLAVCTGSWDSTLRLWSPSYGI